MFNFLFKKKGPAHQDKWTDNPIEIRGLDDGVRSAANEETLYNAALDAQTNAILLARPDVFNAPLKTHAGGTGEGYNFTALSRTMQEMMMGMSRNVEKIGNLGLFNVSHVFRVANETNGVVQEAAIKCLSDMETALNNGHTHAHLITDSSTNPQQSMPHTAPCKETLTCNYTDGNRFTLLSGQGASFAQMDIFAIDIVMTDRGPALLGFGTIGTPGFDLKTGSLARIAGEKHRAATPCEHINGISTGPGLQMRTYK